MRDLEHIQMEVAVRHQICRTDLIHEQIMLHVAGEQ